MGVRSILSKPLAWWINRRVERDSLMAIEHQNAILTSIVSQAKHTSFGEEHGFSNIASYQDFKSNVPVRDYEALKPYIERVKKGETNILWPGKPLYLAKTSGTTSGTKYIPITGQSIPNHINSTRDALLCYIAETGNSTFLDGKLIFLSGSPILETNNGIFIGRLSGIVNHHVPAVLRSNQLPSYPTNCMEDWESKVDKIVEETKHQNMTLISGIPSWVQMYFEKLQLQSGGKTISQLFPNFSLFVYGGVNFEPYRKKFEQSIGKKVDSIELFPASEGFFAFQNKQNDPSLLLTTNAGIFYEFIPADEFFNENPSRLSLAEVKTNVNYALVVSSNAGLWAYSIGDTVKFTSLKPYKLLVTGRIKHFTSAFGEHVIAEEVEWAMQKTLNETQAAIADFHVAPQVNPKEGLPYHEWFIDFDSLPSDLSSFAARLDECMQQKNTYYRDLIVGNVLQPLRITPVKKDAFRIYMKQIGKLGGQNKLPRLSNDRQIADLLKV